MNINLSLRHHCIETEIRKQYNRTVSSYFKSRDTGEREDLEQRIDLLHHALEHLDFGFLRSRHAALRGDSDAAVVLGESESGQIHIQIDGDLIDATNPI